MDVASRSGFRTVHESLRRPITRLWLGTAIIVACELFTFAFATTSIISRHGVASSPGWRCRLHQAVCIVDQVDPGGPAASLRLGDGVFSANGYSSGWLGPRFGLIGLYPGQPYDLVLMRDAKTLALPLRMGADRSVGVPDVIATLVMASLMFLAGIWIRLGGPSNLTARLGSATFLVAGIATVGPILIAYPGWNLPTAWLALVLARVMRPFQMSLGWDFLSRFPHPVSEGWAIRLFRRAVYATAALFWLAGNVPVIAALLHVPYAAAAGSLGWLDNFTEPPATAVFDGVVSAAACLVLLRNYRLLMDMDSRRRIRWAVLSFCFGGISVLLLRLLQLTSSFTHTRKLDAPIEFVDAVTTFAGGLIPITLAYAVVKHRVLGIRLTIRRGIQYLLAKNVLRLLLFAPVLIVLVQIVREPNRTLSDLVLHSSWSFYLLVMGTAALSLRYRRDLSNWLDRRFFRIALQEEETLLVLSESIKNAGTEKQLASAVANQIELALRTEGVNVFLRSPSDGSLQPVSHSSSGVRGAEDILKSHYVDDSALDSAVAVPVPVEDALSPYMLQDEARECLIVPLLGTEGKNLGALVLGPKKSEQRYSRKECELLEAIASQTAMACEVLRLKRSVEQESRQRIAVLGRLEREQIQLLNECLECGECFDTSRTHCPKDGAELQLTLPVERMIAGRYRLNRRLGAGGMGVVYEATDNRINKLVAVKIMLGELFGNRHALARFRREAQTVASLRHPNIVGVHDFGRLPAGGAFLVMDLAPGLSWRTHLRLTRLLHPDRVAGWIEDVCAGVAAAHSSGIVHRDLKPENVIISDRSDREAALILDFGLAKLHSEATPDGPAVSVAGLAIGTRSYMSPEQRSGKSVGPASDIYSIGVMTLETLSRSSPPAEGATLQWARQALLRIGQGDTPLTGLLLSALADDPQARIQRVDELGLKLPNTIRNEKPLPVHGSGSDDAETLSLGECN